jgi:hypothetical protein
MRIQGCRVLIYLWTDIYSSRGTRLDGDAHCQAGGDPDRDHRTCAHGHAVLAVVISEDDDEYTAVDANPCTDSHTGTYPFSYALSDSYPSSHADTDRVHGPRRSR